MGGRPDSEKENDFTSTGDIIDVFSGTASGSRDLQDTAGVINAKRKKELFDDNKTEEIFYNFGQSWMILSQEASLFIKDFDDFKNEVYVPCFDINCVPRPISRNLAEQNNTVANQICGNVTDDFIRQACYFDYAVTGDATLVEATTEIAIMEEENAAILLNQPPVVKGGRNKDSLVNLKEESSFDIIVNDADE